MTQKAFLTGSGVAGQAAQRIVGGVTGSSTAGLTATGSTQATALPISDDINVVTTAAASTGVILRNDLSQGDSQAVVNYGANTLAVYPPVGGKINNAAANAASNLATLKAGVFVSIDGINFFTVVSA